MPVIELHGGPDDIGRVMAIMAFPAAEDLREQFMVVHKANQRITFGQGFPAFRADAKDLETLLNAPSYEELRRLWLESNKRGMIAGRLLGFLYEMDRYGIDEPSMNKAIFLCQAWGRAEPYGDGTSILVSERKIREIWNDYSSVAHLWAAFSLNQTYSVVPQDKLYCQGGFPSFLSLAAELWGFGTSFAPSRPKEGRAFLDEEASWSLPDWMAPIALDLDKPPPELLEILSRYKAPPS